MCMPFWCAEDGFIAPLPGSLKVAGVSAEVVAPVADRVDAVRFLDEVVGWLGKGRRPQDGVCPGSADAIGPYTAWLPGLLRAGTCAAGWCHAPGLAELPGGIFVYLSIERRGAGWELRPIDGWRADERAGGGWPEVPAGTSPYLWIRTPDFDSLVVFSNGRVRGPTMPSQVANSVVEAVEQRHRRPGAHDIQVVSW